MPFALPLPRRLALPRPLHMGRRVPPAAAVTGPRPIGTPSLADLIAPAAVEVGRDHLRLEQEYVRVLAVTGFPRTVGPGWLAPLLEFAEPIEVSLHIEPLESGPMVSALTRQMVGLQSSRLLADRQGRLADPERETAYADAERLRDALQRGEERAFGVALYASVRARSQEELDARAHRAERALAGMLAHSRVAYLEQDLGLHACLPEARDPLGVAHHLDTTSLATTFPFTAGALAMERGALYGIATGSHAPLIVDPFDESFENSNLAIFATSGAGKSYFTKLVLLRLLLQGVGALIVDPEDEYRALCAAVGGQYIRLASTSAQRLNPFDLPPADPMDREERDPLAERVAALVGLLEVMLAEPGRPLGSDERAVLDRALYQTYAEAGIRPGDAASFARPAPLLRDLHAVLAGAGEPAAAGLAARLRRYVHGSLAGLFAGPTNVALDKPCVVFGIQALEPELRALGIHLIAGYVWNLARRERRARLFAIDEAWSLLQYPEGGAFLASLARRARKYYLGLLTITQDVADALGTPHGRTVLTNAACTLLLKQSASTIGPLADAFGLSREERQHLLGAAKGDGLFCCRGARLALRILASPREHELATTAPRELEAREAARRAEATAEGRGRAAGRPGLRPLWPADEEGGADDGADDRAPA